MASWRWSETENGSAPLNLATTGFSRLLYLFLCILKVMRWLMFAWSFPAQILCVQGLLVGIILGGCFVRYGAQELIKIGIASSFCLSLYCLLCSLQTVQRCPSPQSLFFHFPSHSGWLQQFDLRDSKRCDAHVRRTQPSLRILRLLLLLVSKR